VKFVAGFPNCSQRGDYRELSRPYIAIFDVEYGINGKIMQTPHYGGAMFGSTHKWLFIPLLFALLFSIPCPASAQGEIALEAVVVQIWPEYDQPDVLVILNIQLASSLSLPAELTFQLPGNVEKPYVVAVGPTAQTVSDQNIDYTYQKKGEWLEVTVTADQPAIQIEYYDPGLTVLGEKRSFAYLWPSNYATGALTVSLRVPVDTTEVTTDPQMNDVTPAGSGQTLLEWGTSDLEVNEQAPISISYVKTSDRLSISGPLETGIVDENTQGRVSLNNYLPYILGGLGVLLIVGGGIYFWQTSQGKPKVRKRRRSREKDEDGENIYCHQCGKRAQTGDRFCRTCGTRLRRET
jgi:hypothetical protein